MKKNLFFTLIIVVCSMATLKSFGQHKGKGNEDIRAIKISLITDMMNLSSNQSSQFWPVYNKYENEMRTIWRARHNLSNERGKSASEIIEERQGLDERELSVKNKYRSEFLKIVNAAQLNQMYQAESKFKQLLLQRQSR
ncbi:MAG TPA: hypothetical protein PKX92_05275 [Edaphocola sp.]|nr:hypothetical protein [Edaphocola sp.]